MLDVPAQNVEVLAEDPPRPSTGPRFDFKL